MRFLSKLKYFIHYFRRHPISYFIHLSCKCLNVLETEISFSKSSLEVEVLSFYIIRKHRSCSLFILLFKARLWHIQITGRTVIKLTIENCIHKHASFSRQSCQSIQFSIGSLTNGNDMFFKL